MITLVPLKDVFYNYNDAEGYSLGWISHVTPCEILINPNSIATIAEIKHNNYIVTTITLLNNQQLYIPKRKEAVKNELIKNSTKVYQNLEG